MSNTIVLQENVAHNLPRFDRRRKVRDAVAKEPVVTKQRAKVVSRSSGMRISAFAVLLFTAAAALLLVIVYGYMQIAVINSESQTLKKQLDSLKKEENVLTRELDAQMGIAELEDYAVNTLGMVKPDSGHVIFIDLSGEDHGEVIVKQGFFETLRLNIFGAVSNALAYLG